MNKSLLDGSDPETAIVVAEKPIRLNGFPPGIRVRLGLAVGELPKFRARMAMSSSPWSPLFRSLSSVVGIAYCFGGPGLQSPKPRLRSGPKSPVLSSYKDATIRPRAPSCPWHCAPPLLYCAQPAKRTPQRADPNRTLTVLKQRCHELAYQALGTESACRHSN